ncbi:chaperonin 10-like protein [Aspergillus alliaceus]|uniref:Chaperonin 10-like protein n=1 Tax=Petromyces alliaceus TaxID=209559 RepID=A0A5N7CRF2_PETAA|nr:chaperonin 10-like protein [Aspergillus alliaceus]
MAGMCLTEVFLRQVGDQDVLVQFQAVSLNYHDYAIFKGNFPFAHKHPIVASSNSAGVVVQVGSSVREFKRGHQHGGIDPYAASTGVGGIIDGALRLFCICNETVLVKAPKSISSLEGSTLPCVPLTSWNALYGLRPMKAGQSVLVQGTLAKAAGAAVITTTYSETEALRLKELGADHVIDYRPEPNWADVDYIMDIGGKDTLEQSLKCIKTEGIINLFEFLGAIRGLYVGSQAMLKDMVQAFERKISVPCLIVESLNLNRAKKRLNIS